MLQRVPYHRDREGEGTDVTPALTHLHTLKPKEMREDEDERDEEQTVAGRSKNVCCYRLAAGLREHVATHREDIGVGCRAANGAPRFPRQ